MSCPLFYEVDSTPAMKPASLQTLPVADFTRICWRWIEENSESVKPLQWMEPDRRDYEAAFARIQNLITQGQIDKAVPVAFARAEAKVTAAMRARWMMALLEAPATLRPHGYWNGSEGLMGATPETLFELEGRELRTMALAGTLAKADGSAQELARSEKNQHEHRLVVEDLQRELARFGRVTTEATQVLELPTLWHLQTKISVTLEEEADVDLLVKRLHPTPALGVAPRVFGWRWMSELPGQRGRRRFGAPMTFRLSAERVVSLVSIRNLEWDGDIVSLGTGGGVVASSELEAEWMELRRKRQAVLQLLGLNS